MSSPTDEAQAPNYPDGFAIINEYHFEPGVCVLPLAEDPPTDPNELKTWSPVVVLRLHAPYRIRRATSRAKKQQNPPVIPGPGDTGAFVFVSGTLVFDNTLNMTLASYDWEVNSQYTYVENCPSRNEDGFVLGVPPWTFQTSVGNAVQYAGGSIAAGVLGNSPVVGAVASAGPDAQIGYLMGQRVRDHLQDNSAWGYNQPSFFPGSLVNDNLFNAGDPPEGS